MFAVGFRLLYFSCTAASILRNEMSFDFPKKLADKNTNIINVNITVMPCNVFLLSIVKHLY